MFSTILTLVAAMHFGSHALATQCDIFLNGAFLERTAHPFQPHISNLTEGLVSYTVRMKWNDAFGKSTELMKSEMDIKTLPLVTPHPVVGTSVLGFSTAKMPGNSDSDSRLFYFHLIPVPLRDGRTIFDLAILLHDRDGDESTNKLDALNIYAALTVAPFVRYLKIIRKSTIPPLDFMNHFFPEFSLELVRTNKANATWEWYYTVPSYSGWLMKSQISN